MGGSAAQATDTDSYIYRLLVDSCQLVHIKSQNSQGSDFIMNCVEKKQNMM